MANTITAHTMPLIAKKERNLTDLTVLRLVMGTILFCVSLVGLLGGDWDIQWHAVVGRDRTFTPPHDMILFGIGLLGIVALIDILTETQWVKHHHELERYTTDFLGTFHSSLGSYLIGFGAVCSAVAFPLDTYWHSLYGIDVTLWAPFHTMIYMGGVLSTLGIAYMFLSAAHLAEEQSLKWPIRLSSIGVIVAMGALLSKFCTFLTPALQGHSLFGVISIFPLLLALCAAFICVLAVSVVRWTGTATAVVLVFLAIYLLVNAFVPPMMTWLVQAEHQTYLARASRIGIRVVPLVGQTPLLLLVGLAIDGILLLGRRARWSLAALNQRTMFVATVSSALVGELTLIVIGLTLKRAQGTGGGRVVLALLLALLLALITGFVGSWLGITIGKTLQDVRK